MRQVVLSVYVSLDGISDMDENDQWTFPYWNDELEAHQKDLIDRADALLLGRKMFEHFKEAWSPRTNEDDPLADRMNAIPKYVASRSRTAIEGWNGRCWRATHLRRCGGSRSRTAPICWCMRVASSSAA